MFAADLTILHCGRTPVCSAEVDKHFDGYGTLQFSESSGVKVSYDDERYILAKGGAWFWPAYPGPHIRFGLADGCASWDHRYVAFRGPLLQRWMTSGLMPTRPQRAPKGADHAPAFDEILSNARRPDRWSQARAVNQIEAILIDLAIDRAQEAMAQPWLEHVTEKLSIEGRAASLDYDALARDCDMALSTLRRRFRAATGIPLHAYALQRRVDRARDLLAETDEPIKAIAERLGYGDVYYFSHEFRLRVGISPAAYRRSRQRAE